MALGFRTSTVISSECLRATQRRKWQPSRGGGRVVVAAAPRLLTRSPYSTDVSTEPQSPRIVESPRITDFKRGTGGRSSFSGIVCTVFGNTGFLGNYVCNRLGKIGTQMILPHRGDPYGSLRLKLCGDLGQVLFRPFELSDEESILRCVRYSDVVVNLVGSQLETRNYTLERVNAEGAARLARLCKRAGVRRFVHASCLNAAENPTPILLERGSEYFRTKWLGEREVRREFPEATVVRPSDMYGQEDRSFVNVYTQHWRRHLRGIPLWKKGECTEKQPIWVGDVAAGITAIVKDPRTAGRTYQFVGPKRYKLSEIVDWISRLQRRENIEWGHRRQELKHAPIFRLKVHLLERLATSYPFGMMHWEGLEKEHTTDVVVKGLPTLEDLGVKPATMESRMPWEISAVKAEAHYMEQVGEFDPPEPPKTIPLVE